MKIALLSIGNELLEGRILDRNASFAASKLYEKGYLVQEKRTVLDDPKKLIETLEDLLQTHDWVITSGGLGPTVDDLTLPTVCKWLKSSMKFDEPFFKTLKKKISSLNPKHLEYAAHIPEKGHIFSSHAGVVPGYWFKKGRKTLVLLPGVPHEYRHLIEKEVLKKLIKEHPVQLQEHKKVAHLCRIAESEVAPFLASLQEKHPGLKLGIYPHLGIVSIHLKVDAPSHQQALKVLNPIYHQIQKKYPVHFFPHSCSSIQEAIQKLFIKKGWTLSVAESCTGGLLASTLTAQSGCSKYFKSSLVAYDNDIKKKLLNVSQSILKNKGAVSKECAVEMAKGCCILFDTDFAIATTGIAGPTGASKDKPVGEVHIAIAYKGQSVFHEKFLLKGQRCVIQERSVLYALAHLWMIRDNELF